MHPTRRTPFQWQMKKNSLLSDGGSTTSSSVYATVDKICIKCQTIRMARFPNFLFFVGGYKKGMQPHSAAV